MNAYDTQSETASSVLYHYRMILAARAASPVLKLGDLTFLESTADLLVFERFDKTEKRLCIFNFGNSIIRYSTPNTYTSAAFIDAFTRGVSLNDGALEIAPFGYAMIKG
jgi:alpha-glucosidase